MPYTPSTAIVSGSALSSIDPLSEIIITSPGVFAGLLPVGFLDSSNILRGSVTTVTASPVSIYRGRVGGEYVYEVGSAPVGATDVVIVGYT